MFSKLIFKIFFGLCLASGSLSMAKDYYVISNGSPSHGSGTVNDPWQTFASIAWDVFKPGDSLDGNGQSYGRELEIKTSGSAQGVITFKNMVINSSERYGICLENRKYIEIDGINVSNPAKYAVYIAGGNNITIKNCDLSAHTKSIVRIFTKGVAEDHRSYIGHTFYIENNVIHSASAPSKAPEGISVFQGPDWVLHSLFIRNNKIYNIKNGFFMMGHKKYIVEDRHRPYNIHIDGNNIYNTFHNGIMINYGTKTVNGLQSTVSGNKLKNIGSVHSGNVNAMQLNWVDGMIIEHNSIDTVKTNAPDGYGIILDWADRRADRVSNNCIVRYNKVTGCKGEGCKPGKAVGCGGINALFGTNNLIHHNICYGNNVGIAVARHLSTGNHIYNNSLINNSTAGFRVYGDNGKPGKLAHVKNNIIIGSLFAIKVDTLENGTVYPDEGYNLIYNCGADNNTSPKRLCNSTDIKANPQFKSTTDYHLNSNSPAIGAGDISIWQGWKNIKDYDGNKITDVKGKLVITKIDCGAYSFKIH